VGYVKNELKHHYPPVGWFWEGRSGGIFAPADWLYVCREQPLKGAIVGDADRVGVGQAAYLQLAQVTGKPLSTWWQVLKTVFLGSESEQGCDGNRSML
jgi:hypothetical protein